jgi:hypothetical protein
MITDTKIPEYYLIRMTARKIAITVYEGRRKRYEGRRKREKVVIDVKYLLTYLK